MRPHFRRLAGHELEMIVNTLTIRRRKNRENYDNVDEPYDHVDRARDENEVRDVLEASYSQGYIVVPARALESMLHAQIRHENPWWI